MSLLIYQNPNKSRAGEWQLVRNELPSEPNELESTNREFIIYTMILFNEIINTIKENICSENRTLLLFDRIQYMKRHARNKHMGLVFSTYIYPNRNGTRTVISLKDI